MNKKNKIIVGAVSITLLMISIPLIPALETTPISTTTITQNYQSPSYIKNPSTSFICPLLLAITLGFALNSLRSIAYLPEDIQDAIDSYNAGYITAYDLLLKIITTTSIAVINSLYAKSGFRFFYNLYHDLCMGPSSTFSTISLTNIKGKQLQQTPSTISTSTIITNECGCN